MIAVTFTINLGWTALWVLPGLVCFGAAIGCAIGQIPGFKKIHESPSNEKLWLKLAGNIALIATFSAAMLACFDQA